MAERIKFKLLGIEAGYHDKDGGLVEVLLKTDQGPVTLVTLPEVMLEVAGKASQVAVKAHSLSGRTKGHMTVKAETVEGFAAASPVDQPVVVLSLRGSNGIVQAYALSPDQVVELQRQLAEAEPVARVYLKKTIQ